MSNADIWSPQIWAKINGQPGQPPQPGALKTAMGLIRVAQQIFPTTVRGTDKAIPADTIDLKTGIASVGATKQVAIITKSFQLAAMHVEDPELTMAMNQVMLAAQSLALAEDALFFQGAAAQSALSDVKVEGASFLESGLLGKALEFNAAIPVLPSSSQGNDGFVYGSATYKAVVKGISVFGGVQGRPFALILDPATFADANIPLQDSSIVTPASAIRALIDDGHFTMSPSLPPNTGLLVSLGGNTTQLYIGTEPVVEFDISRQGIYLFTARQSIQFHNIDARSLIKLEFKTSA
jgi:uncharacterized linocin/CFP29 family protein